ncbi:MAG: transposase [Deltaproteobacteria bacterium]|nr:transposase [Deltaproteobacteria bacterium]
MSPASTPQPPGLPVSSDRAAAFFQELCWGRTGPVCPRCGHTKAYTLSDDRWRCRSCRHTFRRFTGRWLGRCKIPPEYWLALAADFAAGTHPDHAAHDLGLNGATVLKAYTVIRLALLTRDRGCRSLLDEQGELVTFCPDVHGHETRPSCHVCRSPVLGITVDDENVSVDLFPGIMARDVFGFPLHLKSIWSLVLSDPFQGRTALAFACCCQARQTFAEKFRSKPLAIESRTRFFDHLNRWFDHYRCPRPASHPLYLKEIEARYRHSTDDLNIFVLSALADFIPPSPR